MRDPDPDTAHPRLGLRFLEAFIRSVDLDDEVGLDLQRDDRAQQRLERIRVLSRQLEHVAFKPALALARGTVRRLVAMLCYRLTMPSVGSLQKSSWYAVFGAAYLPGAN